MYALAFKLKQPRNYFLTPKLMYYENESLTHLKNSLPSFFFLQIRNKNNNNGLKKNKELS
jgi:hypothetical protein